MWPLLMVLAAGSPLPCQRLHELEARMLAQRISTAEIDESLATLQSELRAAGEGPSEKKAFDDESRQSAPKQLDQVCALRALKIPSGHPNPAKLNAILGRPEFAHARDRASDAWVRMVHRFLEWLQSLLETSGAQSYSHVTRFIVLMLALALGVFGLSRLRRRPRDVQSHVAATLVPFTLDEPDDHLRRARGSLESNPREALREGLLCLLSELERRRLARPDRTKTNRELGAELPARGAPEPLVVAVAQAMAWYDRVFYSLQPVSSSDARSFLNQVEALRTLSHGVSA